MNIKIQLQEIDYNTIAESFYPSFLKKNASSSNKFHSGLFRLLQLLGDLPLKTLSLSTQKQKNGIAAFLLNNKKEFLMKQLQELLASNEILLTSEDPEISDCEDNITITINNVQITRQNSENELL